MEDLSATNPKTRFILIDGNAIMHRAYHALPPLTTPKGQIVNAVYGFFSMLLTILSELKPTHFIVCFDRPKPTFRQELYAGYQQHRPSMADDLVPQIQMLHDSLQALGAKVFELDGYEADDLIGTLSVQAVKQKKDAEVIIVSGDRDLLQLVNHHVKMLSPITGVKNTILYDSAKVEEKFGIKPQQIIDYKALVGDASDGYPGVSGIGPKTASELLQKYGTFEKLYEHIDELPPKIAEKLATDAEQAALAKKLATIITDAPITLHADSCLTTNLSWSGLRDAFKGFGFKSLTARLEEKFPQAKQEKVTENQDDNEQLGLL